MELNLTLPDTWEDERKYLGVSDFCQPPCVIYHKLNGFAKEPLTQTTKAIFRIGLILEAYYSQIYEIKDAQREITIEPNLPILAHIDGIYQGNCLFECKSTGLFTFNSLIEPKPEHLLQATTYAGFLNIDKIFILYCNKDPKDEPVKEFFLTIDPKKAVDDFLQIVEKSFKLKTPELPENANKKEFGKTGWRCRDTNEKEKGYCRYRQVCQLKKSF
jgi:hypothetical protein